MTPQEKDQYVKRMFNELIECKESFKKPENLRLIEKAFKFAEHAHSGQVRKGGDKLPYIVHPLSVAKIIAKEMGFGVTMVQAALLHDTVEDCEDVTVDTLTQHFGPVVSFLVENVTKITYKTDNQLPEQVETFKQLLTAMLHDRRVAYLKIADRVDNLRTMWDMQENMKIIKSAESLDLYAPLSHLLGLFDIKCEIENLSFEYREPDEFNKIKEQVDFYLKNKSEKIESDKFQLLKASGFSNGRIHVETVQKSYYKIWRMVSKRNLKLEHIHNLFSYRIVIDEEFGVNPKKQCFNTYVDITDKLHLGPKSMKDWITQPKSNGFSSIVLDVYLNGEWGEIQIMTDKMHQIAKSGFADNYNNDHQRNTDVWVRETIEELLNSQLSDSEIMDLLRPNEREINIFTPKGQIVRMPKGATVLDFAFKIHTELGIHFKAAEINGRLVPADFRLREADSVLIIKDDNVTPQPDWTKSLFMKKNINKLQRHLAMRRAELIKTGHEMFDNLHSGMPEKDLKPVLEQLDCETDDELFYKLGFGILSAEAVSKALRNRRGFWVGLLGGGTKAHEPLIKFDENKIEFNPRAVFRITGPSDKIVFSQCCRPVQGDTAMVYMVSENEFHVHKRNCEQAMKLNTMYKPRTAPVVWEEVFTGEFGTILEIEGHDRRNLVLDIVKVISSEMNLNMIHLDISASQQLFTGKIHLNVRNRKNLENLISRMKKIRDIRSVMRH